MTNRDYDPMYPAKYRQSHDVAVDNRTDRTYPVHTQSAAVPVVDTDRTGAAHSYHASLDPDHKQTLAKQKVSKSIMFSCHILHVD